MSRLNLESLVRQVDTVAFQARHAFRQAGLTLEAPALRQLIDSGRLGYVWLPACPRANRVTTTLLWYGLDQQITCQELDPYRSAEGNWRLKGRPIDACFPPAIRSSQPFFYDQQTRQIVSSNSYEMSLTIATAMADSPVPSLYLEEHRAVLDQWNAWLYEAVNLKIYQVAGLEGASRSQGRQTLHQTYKILNAHLSHRHYLAFDQLTETDLRLLHNLVRHEIYRQQFQVFVCPLTAYPYLLEYVRHILAAHPLIRASINFAAIRQTHYRSPHNMSRYGYVEQLPAMSGLFPFETGAE